MDRRRDAAGPRLQGLSTADLATLCCHRRVVGHVLGLEGTHPQAPAAKRPRQPGDDQRLADVRACTLKHDGRGSGQESIAAFAFTPSRNGCLIMVISVTRSAAAISSSRAFRPVTTT